MAARPASDGLGDADRARSLAPLGQLGTRAGQPGARLGEGDPPCRRRGHQPRAGGRRGDRADQADPGGVKRCLLARRPGRSEGRDPATLPDRNTATIEVFCAFQCAAECNIVAPVASRDYLDARLAAVCCAVADHAGWLARKRRFCILSRHVTEQYSATRDFATAIRLQAAHRNSRRFSVTSSSTIRAR